MGGLVEKLECDLITRPAVGLRRSRRIAEIEQKIEAVEEKKIEAGREETKGAACGKGKKRRASREGEKGEDDKGAMKRKRKEVGVLSLFFASSQKKGES